MRGNAPWLYIFAIRLAHWLGLFQVSDFAETHARTLEELEVGLNAVAAPVRAAGGSVVAAVSVAGSAYRVKPNGIAELARIAVAAADQISRRMGYLEESESRAAAL